MDTSPSDPSPDNDLDGIIDAAIPDLKPPPALKEDELQFVTFVHQLYALEGMLMSEQAAVEGLGMPPKEYQRLMAHPLVLDALEERGVSMKDLGTSNVDTPVGKSPVGGKVPTLPGKVTNLATWQKSLKLQSLTPQQLVVANTMLDLIDTRSQKKKLQDMGVPTSLYNTWLKDPVFQQYLRTRAESMLGENQHEAHLALLDKIRMGDIKAITLYYEMQGIYTQASASQVNANQIAVDVQNLLASIIEIISDEVDDPLTAARIADRFKSLMTARTIAGELVNNHIGPNGQVNHVPEIMQSPQLTPELQALMNKGEGYE